MGAHFQNGTRLTSGTRWPSSEPRMEARSNQDCHRQAGRDRAKTENMRKVWLVLCLFPVGLLLAGCTAKKQPVAASPPAPPPIRSQVPPPAAEIIEHCVVVKQENSNTVTCSCLPATTVVDSKTGHVTLVCKKMKEEK